MKSLLDRSFRYTPSFETDIRKTFARIARDRAAAAKADQEKRHADRVRLIGPRIRKVGP